MTRQLPFLASSKRSVAALVVCAFCLGGAPASALAGGKTQTKPTTKTTATSTTTTTTSSDVTATGRKNG
jgi:hypothetical protein